MAMIIAFCVPGRLQTLEFTASWDKLKNYLISAGVNHYLYQRYSADIYDCRNALVSRNLQIPWGMMPCFGGKPYDYMMWIDSDIGFEPSDVMRLVRSGKDIISGVCPMGPTMRCPAGEYGVDANGWPTHKYLNIKAMEGMDEPMEVEWCGFGFLAIKKGVFESMEYPWFRSTPWKHMGRDSNPGEDIGFILRAGEKGWKTWIHPGVKLTHSKDVVLQA